MRNPSSCPSNGELPHAQIDANSMSNTLIESSHRQQFMTSTPALQACRIAGKICIAGMSHGRHLTLQACHIAGCHIAVKLHCRRVAGVLHCRRSVLWDSYGQKAKPQQQNSPLFFLMYVAGTNLAVCIQVESYFFDIRRQLFEYDQVMNTQRDKV